MKIEVDEEVFALLQSKAVPFVDTPNDVLRRLLLDELSHDTAVAPSSAEQRTSVTPLKRPVILRRRPGGLIRLINEGLVKGGDELTHQRKRAGQTFRASVTSEGWVRLPDGQMFSAPSPALKACVGTEIDGWAFWRHVHSGKTLRELRDELSE